MQGYLERTDQVEAPEAVEEVEAMVVEEEEVAPSVLAEISEVFQRTGVQWASQWEEDEVQDHAEEHANSFTRNEIMSSVFCKQNDWK